MSSEQLALLAPAPTPARQYVTGVCGCGSKRTEGGAWFTIERLGERGAFGPRISFCGRDDCALAALTIAKGDSA